MHGIYMDDHPIRIIYIDVRPVCPSNGKRNAMLGDLFAGVS